MSLDVATRELRGLISLAICYILINGRQSLSLSIATTKKDMTRLRQLNDITKTMVPSIYFSKNLKSGTPSVTPLQKSGNDSHDVTNSDRGIPFFLGLYWDISKGEADPEEAQDTYTYIRNNLQKGDTLSPWFEAEIPERLDLVLAIDAMAHEIHAKRPELYETLFKGDIAYAKEVLDQLSGTEVTKLFRRPSRHYFAELMSGPVEILQKGGEKFDSGIETEVKTLLNYYKADKNLLTPAETISLARLGYIEKSDINEDDILVLGGWASVAVVDREGHLITTDALKKALDNFMHNRMTRNIQILHSDVQAGWALPFYVMKDGTVRKTRVYDNKGLFLVCEIRNDLQVVKQVRDEIENGNIRSFSIAGTARSKQLMTKAGKTFYQIDALELAEVSVCEVPVNQESHFTILKSG